ncbi:MAG: CGNR zinc finger domain-containing protein [Ornithinimicrobium sp.]
MDRTRVRILVTTALLVNTVKRIMVVRVPRVNQHSGYGGVSMADASEKVSAIAEAGSSNRRTTPAGADLLCAFANTLDVDVDADPPEALPDAAALTEWLRGRGLIDGDDRADRDDHRVAITLRSGLRLAMMLHNARDHLSPVPELSAVAVALPVQVDFVGTHPRLAPVDGGVRGGLTQLVVAIAEAAADDTWGRLKLCSAEDCLLAFYDISKNRSRHWCSMGACGNREKTRNYRARQQEDR